MSPNAWTLVLIQKTRRFNDSANSLSDREAFHRILLPSANITVVRNFIVSVVMRTTLRGPKFCRILRSTWYIIEVCWSRNISVVYPGFDCKVVRSDATPPRSTLCTGIQALYKIDEILGFFAEGQNFPEYISIYRVESLTKIHIQAAKNPDGSHTGAQ